MASFARKALAAGAQILGGCCGTTPNHVAGHALGDANAFEAQTHAGGRRARSSKIIERDAAAASIGRGGRGSGALVEKGVFVTLVEMIPPARWVDCTARD